MIHTEYDAVEKVWRTSKVDAPPYCLGQSILKILKEEQRKDPKRILEVFHDNGTCSTVEQILNQTITVAQNLERMGLKRGDIVVLYSNGNTWLTPTTFAAYVLGLQVNFFETTFKGDEIVYELGLLDPNLILYEEVFKPQLFGALRQIECTNLIRILNMNSETDKAALFTTTGRENSFQPPDLGDPTKVPAALLLTSGSTGYPKIVVHSHAIMQQGVYSWWSDLPPNSILFCSSPLRWISQVAYMMMPVFLGARRIYTSKPTTGQLCVDIIRTHKVTHYFGVTSVLTSIFKVAQEHEDPSCLDSLSKAMAGGEYVSDALIDFAAKVAPKCKMIRAYGMTESAGVIASDEVINNSVNGGVLLKGLEAKIIDDNGRSLGPNMRGRLCVRQKIPFLKYFKNEKANKETYLEDGWLNTGDYTYMDSQNLLNVITRYKYLVRQGDKIIIPNGVEAMMDSHQGVQSAILVGSPKSRDNPDEIGTIFVVLNKVQTTSEDELKDFMRANLTKEQLEVIKNIKVISTLPVTSCGKVDRTALKNMASGA